MKLLKNIIAIIIVLGLVAWAGVTLVNNKKESEEETRIVAKQNDSISVNTALVILKEIESDYIANGNFEPSQEITLPSEAPGKVERILVKEGDFVKKGQLLAVIRADAQSINRSTAEAAYQNAQRDYQRMQNALTTGGVSQQQVDMAELQLKNAKAQLDQASIQVGDANLRASFDGIVNLKMVEVGSFVAPGTPLFEIVDISSLKLKVEVNEYQIANYKVGDEITVKASVYADKEFTGKISFIAPKATSAQSFPVHIEIAQDKDAELKAGMYGTAIFTSNDEDKNKPVLVIPRKAFVGGLNNTEVFVVEDGKAKLQKISIGANFGQWVEVKDGLKEGQTVVTAGQINLTDDRAVKVINHES